MSPADAAAGSAHQLRALTERFAALLEREAPGSAVSLLEQLLSLMPADCSEYQRYQAAELMAGVFYPRYRFSEFGRIFLEDEPFLRYYERFMDPGNWHSLDRKYTLNQLLKLVQPLSGDAAECGVYQGASALLMCEAFAGSERLVHLFDSFEGLSSPGERDGSYWVPGALRMPESAVMTTLTGQTNYRLYKGWIPERFAEVSGRQFCFVHIDVDLYQPTLDSLAFFYPRLQQGGLILLDDYGFKSCPGAREAADEYFSSHREEIVRLPTGQALVLKQS